MEEKRATAQSEISPVHAAEQNLVRLWEEIAYIGGYCTSGAMIWEPLNNKLEVTDRHPTQENPY